jgi:hypothetical protein
LIREEGGSTNMVARIRLAAKLPARSPARASLAEAIEAFQQAERNLDAEPSLALLLARARGRHAEAEFELTEAQAVLDQVLRAPNRSYARYDDRGKRVQESTLSDRECFDRVQAATVLLEDCTIELDKLEKRAAAQGVTEEDAVEPEAALRIAREKLEACVDAVLIEELDTDDLIKKINELHARLVDTRLALGFLAFRTVPGRNENGIVMSRSFAAAIKDAEQIKAAERVLLQTERLGAATSFTAFQHEQPTMRLEAWRASLLEDADAQLS